MIYSIPAIDLLNGEVVRLQQGHYSKVTKYANTPLQIASEIADLGYSALHIIDLMGAKTGTPTIFSLLDNLLRLGLSVQVGGGIRRIEQAKTLIAKGVDRVIISTSALTEPKFFSDLIKSIGVKRVVLSLDIREGLIATHGWSQCSGKTIRSVLENYPALRNLIVTDISKDGTLASSINYNLYSAIINDFPDINLIAAGGISSIKSIQELNQIGCHACIIGKAYYEIEGLKETIVTTGFHRSKIC